MVIKHREDEETGSFYVEKEGETIAEMVYAKMPGRIVIQHTEVDGSLRGQNIALQLVENGVEYARQQHLKVVPLCRFAKKMIEKHPELQDVL
jgi:predicted GNAT family acetyltransferase